MYRQEGNTLQGERGAKAVRFKQNIIFFIFLGTAAGILLSFYTDIITGVAVTLGAAALAFLQRKRKIGLVLLFVCLSFVSAWAFEPTEAQKSNAEAMGMNVRERRLVRYEFFLDDVISNIRAVPVRVLGERGNYVTAVMFGDKSELDKSVKDSFWGAGISHILAVSGLHAGIIMSFICNAMKNVKRKIRLPFLYACLAAMTALSGFSPSVLRAGLMMGIYLIADTFGYRYNLLNSLFLAGTIILLAVPYNLFNVSFLLSFTATLGIGLFYPDLSEYLNKWGSYIGGGVAMYIACQLTSLPILIMVFSELSVLGVFGNLFTIPIVSFALMSGMLGYALYPLGLSYYPFSFSAAFMEMIEYIAGLIARVSFSTLETGSIPLVLAVVYYGIIGLLCTFVFKDKKQIYTGVCVCMAIMIVVGIMAV